jgi:hypothetical protein
MLNPSSKIFRGAEAAESDQLKRPVQCVIRLPQGEAEGLRVPDPATEGLNRGHDVQAADFMACWEDVDTAVAAVVANSSSC